MVIFFECHQTAVDPKSSSFLPMTGEDTGLGALASPLAGYLGKVQDRAASLEYCPWCTSKGFTYALRSYRINLQESITLCTNPQCLFPLVTRPLEDVLASLDPVEPTVGNKRKNAITLENEELIKPSVKRLRSDELGNVGPQSVTDTPVIPTEHAAENIVRNGQLASFSKDDDEVNHHHKDCVVTGMTRLESLQDKDIVVGKDSDSRAPSTCPATVEHSSEVLLISDELSPHGGALGIENENDFRLQRNPPEEPNDRVNSPARNQSLRPNEDIFTADVSPPQNEHTAPLTADITTCKDTESRTSVTKTENLVPVPKHLFWRNSDNLCWLDSLLAALVNCKSLRKLKPKDKPRQSSVWQLMTAYEDICAAIQVHQQTGIDGAVRVPEHVLHKANADLQSLRMSVFKLLQPRLHCKLGRKETPVFAMPLLLTMDSWAESLFQLTFQWRFRCSECKVDLEERVMKTLPTFTHIVHDWRPLRAVHLAPCNVCRKKNQMRTMMLERVPPVFVLHFVEGLPDNDVSLYSFDFNGQRYSISTVIQYNQQLKHFITWVSNADGSWLELDDLKHPDCNTHPKLQVPAREMHVVFWEAEEDKGPRVCSPSSALVDSTPAEIPVANDRDLMPDELLACSPDQSLVLPHDDTDIVCALSESIMDTTVAADTSIGGATLLDTFEGLTHDDIVTLTLVEVKAGAETQPHSDGHRTQVPSINENSAPDSSSAASGSDVCRGPEVEVPTDSTSSDPTFVPGAGRGRGRRAGRKAETAGRQRGKKAVPGKAAPRTSADVNPEPSKSAQHNKSAVEVIQQTSPVSSTETSCLSTNQKMPATVDQNARWSFLLSKLPMNQVNKSIAKLAPPLTPTSAPQVKPSPLICSTPHPVKRQHIPALLHPKPQLRTEGSEGLPLKAAEKYGAFGAKSSNTVNPLPPPSLLSGKPKEFQPITVLSNTTVMSGTSPPTEVSYSKKHSSKIPAGLSTTEALRYKLLKKLKAKKKKLAKLNEMLGTSLQPDSTRLDSPSTVTSSTCDDILSDLLSPATTASNLSPDSTGFLEMIAGGQDGADRVDCAVGASGGAGSQANSGVIICENFLDEFLSQAAAQRPSDLEAEALSALELFI